jgi:hypothetical protein
LDNEPRYIVEVLETFTAHPGWRLLSDHANHRKEQIVARIVQEDVGDAERATLAAEYRAITALIDYPRQELVRAENQE